jgi:hypothetical protein
MKTHKGGFDGGSTSLRPQEASGAGATRNFKSAFRVSTFDECKSNQWRRDLGSFDSTLEHVDTKTL